METVSDIVGRFEAVIIKPAMLLIFTAGFFMFVWGLVVFLFNLGDKSEHTKGKEHIVWGLVGMFVMVSVYGILALLNNTFDLGCDPKTRICNPDMSRIEKIIKPTLDANVLR